MWAGVGKSGSPAPRPMLSSPAAMRALARASMARVADSSMAATSREMYGVAGMVIGRFASSSLLIPRSTVKRMTTPVPNIDLPAELRPGDGRFGSGPSKVRPEAVTALAAAAPSYLGTSHRQAAVKSVVRRLREGLTELFSLPDGYEVVLGNGGTTAFWDAAAFGLVERRAQHLSFGEFSSKFAAVTAAAPFLDAPEVIESPPGTHPEVEPNPDVDVYAFPQTETSTGVAMEVRRPAGADGLVLVDATSGAA